MNSSFAKVSLSIDKGNTCWNWGNNQNQKPSHLSCRIHFIIEDIKNHDDCKDILEGCQPSEIAIEDEIQQHEL